MPLVTMDMNLNSSLKKAEISPNSKFRFTGPFSLKVKHECSVVVPENFTPSTLVSATYANGEDVALGNFIKPSESADIPKVAFIAPDETAEYTLLVVRFEH